MEWISGLRKTTILRHPTLTCLSRFHTINLLSGCPYECRYCYTQSFPSHPGWGRIVVYTNTYELLERQLPRMRRKPSLVYFSTACEPFVPQATVLDLLYRIMRLLLENRVGILISSKSKIPANFIELFGRYSRQVHVQVGLTTADDSVRRLIEPKAPRVAERSETLKDLCRRGILCEIRADPIIPELTDTEENLRGLFGAASELGVRQMALSYLFIRPATAGAMSRLRMNGFDFQSVMKRLYTQTIENYCGEGIIRVVDAKYRKKKYEQIRKLAGEFGIGLHLCRCKNPDVTEDCCHSSFLPDGQGAGGVQAELNFEENNIQ